MAMLKIDKILCPVDFSETSDKAYDYAYSLASHYEARLYVLHVIDVSTSQLPYYNYDGLVVNSLYEELDKSAAERLRAKVSDPARRGVQTETSVVRGLVPDSILSFAHDQGTALIVMGTHGRRGLSRVMMGSVAERVLRYAPCPVLAVGKTARDFVSPQQSREPVNLGKILLCTDFSQCASVALRYALSLAQEYNAELTLLHVLEKSSAEERCMTVEDARKKLESLIPEEARNWCSAKAEVRVGNKPYKEIIQLAEEGKMDVAVLGVRGRGAMDLVVFGSTTNRVLELGPCPVLAVQEGALS